MLTTYIGFTLLCHALILNVPLSIIPQENKIEFDIIMKKNAISKSGSFNYNI